MKKIVVPEGMMKAAIAAWRLHPIRGHDPQEAVCKAVEAALIWQSENPIIPKQEQIEAARRKVCFGGHIAENYASMFAELQRGMFLAPEPPVPESVKHLLLQGQWDPMPSRDVYNQRIIDAYNQGKKSSVPSRCTHPFTARFKVDDHIGCEYIEVCGTCMKVFK
jgi:hypothetical protein